MNIHVGRNDSLFKAKNVYLGCGIHLWGRLGSPCSQLRYHRSVQLKWNGTRFYDTPLAFIVPLWLKSNRESPTFCFASAVRCITLSRGHTLNCGTATSLASCKRRYLRFILGFHASFLPFQVKWRVGIVADKKSCSQLWKGGNKPSSLHSLSSQMVLSTQRWPSVPSVQASPPVSKRSFISE